jgi:hypothetical protein
MTEDASQSTATSTTTNDNTSILTSKVPTLHNQKLNLPTLASSDEKSKCLTVNCPSHFRKRLSMTDSGKEIQDSSFLGPFSKRHKPDHHEFKVSNPTNMPVRERYDCAGIYDFNKRDNMKSDSDSLHLENRVMASSSEDPGSKLTTSERYQVTSEEEVRSLRYKSLASRDAKLNESDKIQKKEVEDLKPEKDSGIQLKQKETVEDTKGLCVSVHHVMEACVTLSDSNIQCQRFETNASRTELKVQSSDESKQNTNESAKSDQAPTRDNCESVDSRQSPTSEQQKGDSSAPDSHQTKLNCDLCGKVQSCQESLQKVC